VEEQRGRSGIYTKGEGKEKSGALHHMKVDCTQKKGASERALVGKMKREGKSRKETYALKAAS